jgi:hypothetical protein
MGISWLCPAGFSLGVKGEMFPGTSGNESTNHMRDGTEVITIIDMVGMGSQQIPPFRSVRAIDTDLRTMTRESKQFMSSSTSVLLSVGLASVVEFCVFSTKAPDRPMINARRLNGSPTLPLLSP